VLAVLGAVVAVTVFSIISLREDQVQLQDRNVPYAVALATVALNAKGMANDERGFLISGDPQFLEELDQRLINARTALAEAASAADGEGQSQAVREAQAGFEEWVWAIQREFETFKAGDRESAVSASLGSGRTLRKNYEAMLEKAQVAATTAIQLRRNSFASSGWVIVLLACLLVMVAIGFGLTFWLARALDVVSRASETPDASPGFIPVPRPPAGRLGRDN
jgi:methyl-accepting chemotaxis protein